MKKILQNLPKDLQKKIKKKKQPSKINPMLAKLTHDKFYKKGWIYERKLDGERVVAIKNGKKIYLKSRNYKKLNDSYPEIEKEISKLKEDKLVLDGEMVAFEGNVTSFSRLQDRMHIKSRKEAENSNVAVYYYIFDIIYFGGYDISKLPLNERKRILKEGIDFSGHLRYTPHRTQNTKKYYQEACRKGWEGLIVKKEDSKYVHSRSGHWLKFKCVHEQEFVIGGYTEPQGSREGFGAILVGYYKKDKLHYAGKIGTGFDDEELKRLKKKFKKLEIDENHFSGYDDSKKSVHWIKPKLVCQAGFTEWTKDNKLRHPRFLGMRRDKSPKKVHKEK